MPVTQAPAAPAAAPEAAKPAPAKAPRSQAASPAPPAAPPATTQYQPQNQQPPQPRTATPQPEPVPRSPPPPAQPASWAALVKHKETNAAATPPPKTPPPAPAAAPAPAPIADSAAPLANGGGSHGPGSQDGGAGGMPLPAYPHCIIIRNLPQEHLPTELLEGQFAKFGALKRGGGAVTIHNLGRDNGKVGGHATQQATQGFVAGICVVMI